jgi:hypothetical protein
MQTFTEKAAKKVDLNSSCFSSPLTTTSLIQMQVSSDSADTLLKPEELGTSKYLKDGNHF